MQKKVVQEIEDIFDDLSDAMTMEKLNKLTYLDRCIKEALRLYPSAAFMGRMVYEEVQLSMFLLISENEFKLRFLHRFNGTNNIIFRF
jgi:cytochrome P450